MHKNVAKKKMSARHGPGKGVGCSGARRRPDKGEVGNARAGVGRSGRARGC